MATDPAFYPTGLPHLHCIDLISFFIAPSVYPLFTSCHISWKKVNKHLFTKPFVKKITETNTVFFPF